MFVFDTNTFSEPQGTLLSLLSTAEVMRMTFKSSMIMEAGMEAGIEAGMKAAEGVGVWGHPGETRNAVAATDLDQGAKIDQLENGKTGNAVAATDHDQGAKIDQFENRHRYWLNISKICSNTTVKSVMFMLVVKQLMICIWMEENIKKY